VQKRLDQAQLWIEKRRRKSEASAHVDGYVLCVSPAFSDWDTAANSISYLLGVWSRMAGDVSQLRVSADTPLATSANTLVGAPPAGTAAVAVGGVMTPAQQVQSLLLEIIPNICQTFINARLASIAATLQNERQELINESSGGASAVQTFTDIFSEPNLSDQLKYLSTLCRFHLGFTKNYLKSKLLPLFEQYKNMLQSMLQGQPQFAAAPSGMHSVADSVLPLTTVECQLTMLFYIVGAVVGSEKSVLPLHPATAYAGLYTFPGADKITYKGV
jgi:hypothetical protein